MTTATYEGPSQVELQLLLRSAALGASPQEHGRAQARRATGSLVRGLSVVAATLAVYDASLLLGAV